MRVIQISIACVCALLVSAVVADVEKSLVCHVGSEAGPNGETYLDDPTCIPSDANAYFCPDAGKVDLLVVAKAEKHLDNASHGWDGFFDYEPSEVGASGDGTEDTDGDGIDEGCEPPPVCPCWGPNALQAVTSDNYGGGCEESRETYPLAANIGNDPADPDTNPNVEGGFSAVNFPAVEFVTCGTRNFEPFVMDIEPDEAAGCIEDIAARCSALGIPLEF